MTSPNRNPLDPLEVTTEAEIRAVDLEGQAPAVPAEDEERLARIRRAAYARYEKRGFVPGRDEEDWLAAEREIDPARGDAADDPPEPSP